ncbi:hypothetical protein ALT1000_360027 [Alteromonas macleodii]
MSLTDVIFIRMVLEIKLDRDLFWIFYRFDPNPNLLIFITIDSIRKVFIIKL